MRPSCCPPLSLLRPLQVNYNRYKYFMLINSSVKGPFMPAYAEGLIHWTDPFLRWGLLLQQRHSSAASHVPGPCCCTSCLLMPACS
jgi:hypothetical protein